MHLIGNMAYLYIFADNIEDNLENLNLIFYYLVVYLQFCQALIDVNSEIPMIGVSERYQEF